jgi:hypothetical protein
VGYCVESSTHTTPHDGLTGMIVSALQQAKQHPEPRGTTRRVSAVRRFCTVQQHARGSCGYCLQRSREDVQAIKQTRALCEPVTLGDESTQQRLEATV